LAELSDGEFLCKEYKKACSPVLRKNGDYVCRKIKYTSVISVIKVFSPILFIFYVQPALTFDMCLIYAERILSLKYLKI